jgi:hypothetical protein
MSKSSVLRSSTLIILLKTVSVYLKNNKSIGADYDMKDILHHGIPAAEFLYKQSGIFTRTQSILLVKLKS